MKTKVFYMGRRVNSRFDSFKAACKRVVRFIVRWSLISAAAYALFMGGAMFYSTSTVSASFPEIKEVDHTPLKIASLKAEVVTKIMNCERNGYTEEDGLVHIDNNEKGTLKGDDILSYGLLQWKTKTVQLYVKLRDGKAITAYEAKLIAFDKEKAAALAEYTIFEQDGLRNWLRCANQLNLRPQVDAIKFLEK